MREYPVQRGVRSVLAGMVLGSLAAGPYASAGFQNPGPIPLPPSNPACSVPNALLCNCPVGTSARLNCDVRSAYYSVDYGNENGPYPTKQQAIHGALMASYWMQAQEAVPGQGEWGSMIYRDMYGMWWFTDVQRGIQLPDGSWLTNLHAWDVHRPGTTIGYVEHSHPSLMYDPTGTNNGGPGDDNESDHPMFVIRADDTVWYFPPGSHKAIYYGYISDGQVQTKFTTIGTTGEINFGADPYGIAGNQGKTPEDADYSWITYTVAIVLASTAISTVIFLIAIGALGGASGGNAPPPDITDCSGPFCGFFPHL